MNDINTTSSTSEATPTTVHKETNMETATAPTTRRLADLTKADRAALVRIFGALPDAPSVCLTGRKGSAKTQPECECGCGVVCPSLFVAGHDARLHSVLLSLVKDESPKSPNHRAFTKTTAKAELSRRGW